MAKVTVPSNYGIKDGGIYVWETTLIAGAGGTATETSANAFNGEVVRVDLITGTLDAGADLTAKDTNQDTATTAYFVNKTNISADTTLYPVVQCTDNNAGAVSGEYQPYPIAGKIVLSLSSAVSADDLTVRVYIKA